MSFRKRSQSGDDENVSDGDNNGNKGHGVVPIAEENETETEDEDNDVYDILEEAESGEAAEEEQLVAPEFSSDQYPNPTRMYDEHSPHHPKDVYHPLLSSPSKAPDFQDTHNDFGYGSMDLSMLLNNVSAPTVHTINNNKDNNTTAMDSNTRGTNAATTPSSFQRVPQKTHAPLQQNQQQQQHQRVTSEFSFFTSMHRNARKRFGSATGAAAAASPGHHRRQSSISRLMDSLGDGLTHGIGTILHDVQDSARDVKRSWKEELETANDGRFGFLDASLMRGLSILPEDMESWADQARESDRLHLLEQRRHPLHEDEEQLIDSEGREDVTTDHHDAEIVAKRLGAGPYLALLVAVLAVSSNGTALTLQSKLPPALKLYWRMVGTALVLVPFAMRLLFWKEGFPRLNVGQWATLGLAVACYVAHNLCFITALTYTSIGNAVLFANTQALILLAGKALTGVEIESLEYLGAIVAFSGAIMCATDEQRVSFGENNNDATIGDLLAMVSAVFGVGYLTFAKAVRPATSVVTFMFLVMSAGSCLVLLYMTITNEYFTVDRHPYHGLFGWMSLRYDRLPLELWIVLVCNVVGTMGFVRSMQYFDAIIIAISTLLEPMVASVIATLLHVGVLPGPQGWVGNFLVVIGTFAVVYPSATKGDNNGGGH